MDYEKLLTVDSKFQALIHSIFQCEIIYQMKFNTHFIINTLGAISTGGIYLVECFEVFPT